MNYVKSTRQLVTLRNAIFAVFSGFINWHLFAEKPESLQNGADDYQKLRIHFEGIMDILNDKIEKSAKGDQQ